MILEVRPGVYKKAHLEYVIFVKRMECMRGRAATTLEPQHMQLSASVIPSKQPPFEAHNTDLC